MSARDLKAITAMLAKAKPAKKAAIARVVVAAMTPTERLIVFGIDPFACRRCGREVEEGRRCYAIPTCYGCLPPPPPLEVLTIGE